MKSNIKKLTYTAVFIAIGILLPLAAHLVAAGPVLLPMHIPVLLCGLLCGMPYGAFCGFIVPFISSIATGMPNLFPTAVAMSLELMTYGILSGLLYQRLRWNIYPALIVSMLAGRAVSGIVNALLLGFTGGEYSLAIFLTTSFVTGLPGIVIQIVLIPCVVFLVRKVAPSPAGLRSSHD